MLRISLRKVQTLSAVAQTRVAVSARQFSSVEDHAKFVTDNQVTIIGTSTEEYPPFLSFDETPFHPLLKKVLKKDNFASPSPIQAVSWPIGLDKKDIISVAKTGSGKTLGFLLPGFQNILSSAQQQPAAGARSDRGTFRRSHKAPQMLILAPTRELSNQIAAEATKYQSAGIATVSLYGGAHKGEQVRALRNGADVVVATPGRCNDLIEDGAFDTSKIKYLVLDEADRMLDMGFEPQIRQIIDQLPHSDEGRQTLFFTATWPREVQQLAREFLADPVQVNIGNQDSLNANKDIKQNIISTKGFLKNDALLDLLEQKINPTANPKSLPKSIIFTSTKSSCDELAMELRRAGYSAAALHGDKTQAMRDDAMRAFRNNRVSILIATDIAARGLDVKDIENVINYDFPNNTEDYVHRIGRTARGGATGTSYTFLTNKDLDNRRNMSDLVGVLTRCEQEVPAMLEGFAKGNSRYSEQRTTAFGGGRGGSRSGGGGGGKFGRGGDRFGGGGDRGGDRFGDRYGPIGGGNGSGRPERSSERFERGDRFGGGGDRAPRGDRFGGDRGDSFGERPPRSSFGGDRGGDRFGGDRPRSSSGFGGERNGGFRAPRFAEQGDDEYALSGGSFTKRAPSAYTAPPSSSSSPSSGFGFPADEFAELEELRRSHSARKAGPF